MDTKALAKSKRAHSLHHSKKHHPHQTSKAPSPSLGKDNGVKKQAGKQGTEKRQHSLGSKILPSNWVRYEEEIASDSEEAAEGSSSQAAVVVRKSKGADYAHLISEAKTQSQENYSADIFSSFNDVLDDFTQGFGPLLSVRGKSIMSWISDDNFKVEEKSTVSYAEEPFLSLNLHVLAEQLAKAKVSERLFAEPDLLPPEMLDELQECSEDRHDLGQISYGTRAFMRDDIASSLSSESEKSRSKQQNRETISPASTAITEDLPIPLTGDVTHTDDELSRYEQTNQRSLPEAESISNVDVDIAAKKSVKFEAADAEAELDLLLDSFGETKFESSSVIRSNNLNHGPQVHTSAPFTEFSSSAHLAPAQNLNTGENVMESAKPALINNTIDELLHETSDMTNRNIKTLSHDANAGRHGTHTSSDPVSKSKLLDDFDSWLDTI